MRQNETASEDAIYMYKLAPKESMITPLESNGLMNYLTHPEMVFISHASPMALPKQVAIHAYIIKREDFFPIEFDEALLDESISFMETLEDGEQLEVELPTVMLMKDNVLSQRSPYSLKHVVVPSFSAYGWKEDSEIRVYDFRFLSPITNSDSKTSLEQAIAEIDSNPAFRWSDERTVEFNFYEDYLNSALKTRYATVRQPSAGVGNNLVVDSYLPRLLVENSYDVTTLRLSNRTIFNGKGQCISPLTANLLGARQIPIDQLCKVLGYERENISTLLKTVKMKGLTLVLAGTGGTGMNTAYWLAEMAGWCNVKDTFSKVKAFDKETVELSNILRFPIDPNATLIGGDVSSPYKVELIRPLIEKLSQNSLAYRSYLPRVKNCTESNILRHNPELVNVNDEGDIRFKEDVIVYGAPGLDARATFSKMGNFIAGIHSDNGCNLLLNPDMGDQALQVESYGMIQLSAFFMNQLRMAIGLLEVLGSDQDLSESDTTLLSYSFKGERLLPTDRTYTWNLVPEDRLRSEGLQ